MRTRILFLLIFLTLFSLKFITHASYAADNAKLAALSKQIIEAKDCSIVRANLDEASKLYSKENKYNEFVDLLNSILKQKSDCNAQVNYYIALSRYQQLNYLEESQGWDEYFAKGNDYRSQITEGAQKALETLSTDDPLSISTRLLFWQFHRDQQDTFNEQALNDLVNSLNEYAKGGKDIQIIKVAADKIYSYGEKGRAKEIYRLYVNKIISSSVNDEGLGNIAAGFLKEGNIDLAETIYDIYVDRITKNLPKDKTIPLLISLAKVFAFSPVSGEDQAPKDMIYAEKIFAKIEDTGGKNSFDEALNYLRALNLEKAKDYRKSRDLYLEFSSKYPESAHNNEAIFKVAAIDTYILRDRKSGNDYFVKLAEQEKLTAHSISALYQLGLLSQWDNDTQKAKAYYNKLIEKANGNFSETVMNAKDRLKEIEGSQPLENNLKLFLDLALKDENSQFDMSRVNLSISPYFSKKGAQVTINSNSNADSSGCLQVDLQYAWGADLGSAKPQANMASFPTSYKDAGTKIVFLVVSSSGSAFDRSLDMLDVE